MLGAWTVGVFLNFATNGPVTMQRLASQTSLANSQLLKQQGLIDRNALAMQRYRARIDELNMSQMRFGTRASGMLALAGAATIAYSLKNAGDLQTAMTGVAATTHATLRDYGALQGLVIQQSGLLAQSTTTIAREMQTVAQTAFPRTADLSRMFPMMARYADVRMMSAGEDPVAAATGAAQLAHLMQAFTPSAMQSMLNQLINMQMVTHATTSQLVTQGRYFMPSAKQAGVSDSDIMDQMTSMAQGGFMSGRGGAALKNIILASSGAPLITSFATAMRYKFMRDLGVMGPHNELTYMKDGHLQLEALFKHLNVMRHHMSSSVFQRDVSASYGQTAVPYLLYATSDAAMKQLDLTTKARNMVGGVMAVWEKFSNTFLYQWKTFTTNLQNVFTALGLPWLGNATNNLKAINGFLASMNENLTKNPGMAKALGTVIGVFTALAAIRFSVGSVMLLGKAASAIGLIGEFSGGIGGFFKVLDLIFTGGLIRAIGVGVAGLAAVFGAPIWVVVAGIGALAAAGYGIYQAIKHWPDITAWFHKWSSPFINALVSFFKSLNDHLPPWARVHTAPAGSPQMKKLPPLYHAPNSNGAPVVPGQAPVHIQHFEMHVHDAHDAKKVAMVVRDLLRNPLSTMFSGDSTVRTHPFIPQPLSTPNSLGFA